MILLVVDLKMLGVTLVLNLIGLWLMCENNLEKFHDVAFLRVIKVVIPIYIVFCFLRK